MDSHITKLLKKYHLKVFYLPISSKGYCIPTPDSQASIIIINETLSNEEREQVILHEIGHVKNDDEKNDYKSNYATRIYSENGANNFMVHEQVKKYIALGNDAYNANWLNIAKSIGTQNYLLVRNELLKYTID